MKTTAKKIIITGGHLAPALAVIDEIHRQKLPWEILFIGRTRAVEGGHEFNHEQRLVESRGVRFAALKTGRLQRSFSLLGILSLLKIPFGIFHALCILLSEKPDCVVSFGGYIALPVALSAWCCRVPVITHEQTLEPGLANSIIAHIAQRICVSFPETLGNFPKQKTVITGLPIRAELFESSHASAQFGDISKYPIIYVTGGTTGAVSMNELLFPCIESLVAHYTVIHQTGRQSFNKALGIQNELPHQSRSRYFIFEFIDAEIVGGILRDAKFVISRSGANTVMELALLKKKSLVFPLPWSGAGEQMKNARWLEKMGLARVVDQTNMNSDRLKLEIEDFLSSPFGLQNPRELITNGTQRLVVQIQKLLI